MLICRVFYNEAVAVSIKRLPYFIAVYLLELLVYHSQT